MYQAPRGTVDILPEEQAYWRYVEQKAAAICSLYGYERIDTPTFENTKLFARGIGDGTDIVEKEMYSFKDKGDNDITLRPEGTASICRAYIEHGMANLPQPVKLYYLTSIFRYERPQAGRLREHHQFGYEAIGDADPVVDTEVIEMAWRFFQSLGLEKLSLLINSIGCKECRPNYLETLRKYYQRHSDNLCKDCRTRLERNTLRLLDCKQSNCRQFVNNAPKSIDYLCEDCGQHFNLLQKYLDKICLPYSVNHKLVRGLDYYTRTVFEIQPELEGGQSTIGGGGRYDNLISELEGKPTPAVGFATGIERIILNLKREGIAVPALYEPSVFIASMGDNARETAVKLSSDLRNAGIGVVQSTGTKSLKAQLRQANNLQMQYAVIIGDEEVASQTVILKDMAGNSQENLPVDCLIDKLKG
ncbi:MAG: histidine--tRNA ligase [Dehalococcoidales bacterium]|nr:histidine--tRNA ligase [Dehalococcoidales bacterium]